jgi:putative hydrolase of the HAD superfamily
MIKAIIFDCFGVILTDALSVIVGEFETRNPEGAREIRSLNHAANRGILEPEEATKLAAAVLGVSVGDYRNNVRQGEVRDQQLLDYIKVLKKKYKTAMLSNVTQQGIDRRFPDNELDQYFDVLGISSTMRFAKPEPEAYLTVAERLGVKPQECIFTDDRPEYCMGAEAVGMRSILYRDLAQFKPELERALTTD